MTPSGLKVRVVDSPAAIESLVPEWRALERATPEATGFQSPAWRNCVAADVAPRLVAVREKNGRLALLLCLQVHKALGVRAACWLGEPLAQYGDALALPEPDRPLWLEAALAEMRGFDDVDLLALSRVRADGALASCGLALSAPCGGGAAPFVDLRAADRPRRRSIERRIKKLADFGPLRLERVGDARGRREAALQALAFKRAWLKSRRRFSAALSAPGAQERLLALAESGALAAHRLWAGERLASVEIGLRVGTTYRSLIGAYDPELASAAPGHALTLRLLDRLTAEGLQSYDFLPPDDDYKYVFANGAVAMGAHYHALNLRGALAGFALQRLRPVAKALAYGALDRVPALERLVALDRIPSLGRIPALGRAAKAVAEAPARVFARRPV